MSSHWPPVRMSPELGLGDFQKWLLFGKPGAAVSGTGSPRQDPRGLCAGHTVSPQHARESGLRTPPLCGRGGGGQ